MVFRAFILLGFLLLSACGEEEERLRIVVANSVRPAAEALIRECPHLDRERTDLVFTSSGKAVAQVRKGAPFDLFMSADRSYPEALRRMGHAQGEIERFGYGVPVLHARDRSLEAWEDAGEALKELELDLIAVADPKTAPFGRLSEAILEKEGVNEALEGKKVYGSGIAELERYLRTGNVGLGITSLSTALDGSRGSGQPRRRGGRARPTTLKGGRGEGAEEVVKSSHLRASSASLASLRLEKKSILPFQKAIPLPQSMVRIERGRSPEVQEELARFFRFILSSEGQRILREHGHLPAERRYACDMHSPDA